MFLITSFKNNIFKRKQKNFPQTIKLLSKTYKQHKSICFKVIRLFFQINMNKIYWHTSQYLELLKELRFVCWLHLFVAIRFYFFLINIFHYFATKKNLFIFLNNQVDNFSTTNCIHVYEFHIPWEMIEMALLCLKFLT